MPTPLPDDIQQTPASFAPLAERVNALLGAARAVQKAVGQNGIKVTVGDDKVIIRSPVPPDFVFEKFTICDNGAPADRWIMTWASDPDQT